MQIEKISLFDPVMVDEDDEIISNFKCARIASNSNGKFISNNITLFYMPHCPLGLYGNLLMANWKKEYLTNTIIIGNSFSNYDARRISSDNKSENSEKFLYKSILFLKEFNLELRGGDFGNAFNDQFLHIWKELPNESDHDYWTCGSAESESAEIIKEIKRLQI